VSYFVKWIQNNRKQLLQTGVPYTRQAEAMDFACLILGQTPRDIWIEDGRGTRIALQSQIIQHCRMRGRAD
jgi:hypothetical protein